MKRNKIMALTALLTLIGAPLSKAQETKGGSQQSTSAQSANKDSKAVDKTKEQNKNLEKTKDSKAPQQTKDSKTADKKEETKKDSKNAQQTKEQPKDSKKDGKKENKNSDVASNETLLNRMVNLGYSLEWIKKNWPWLAAIGGTGLVSGVAGNKMGKKANVEEKVKQAVSAGYTKNADVEVNYVLKTNQEGIKAEAAKFGIKYNDEDLNKKAEELANGKKYTEDDLNNKVNEAINQKITNKELVKAADVDAKVQQSIKEKINKGELFEEVDENTIKNLANGFGIKYTDNDLEAKAQQLANNKKYTEDDLKKAVNEKTKQFEEKTKQFEENIAKIKGEFKYTEGMHKEGIVNALNQAYKIGTIREMYNEKSKYEFDKKVKELNNKTVVKSFSLIKNKLSQNFADILVKTKCGEFDNDDKKTLIKADQMVDAFVMLSDIKNALVNGIIGKNLTATIENSNNTKDAAWSKFKFKINLRSYTIFLNHKENESFYVTSDNQATEYLIPLEEKKENVIILENK